MTLREIIIENVGTDIATSDYLAGLGYEDLDIPVEAKVEFEDHTVYALGFGYHISVNSGAEYFTDGDDDIDNIPDEKWVTT
jgi:enhancing lycopene biosynthesis protein 2